MFANIAVSFLISLGAALVLLLVAKGLNARFSPEALHFLVSFLVVLTSTAALTVALTSGKAYRYVTSLEQGAKSVTAQADALLQDGYGLDRYGLSASDIADGYIEGAASLAKTRLARTRTLSIIVASVLNILLALFLFQAAGKMSGSRSREYADDTDDLDDGLGGGSSYDDLDFD